MQLTAFVQRASTVCRAKRNSCNANAGKHATRTIARCELQRDKPNQFVSLPSLVKLLRKRLSSSHLDGTYPGDAGFDPLHFGKDPDQLKKLREAEVMHARWAMIGVVGLVLPEILGNQVVLLPDILHTGPILSVAVLFVAIIAGVEGYRAAYNARTTESEERVYPGKPFDFLGFTKDRTERAPGLGVFSAWIGGLPGWLSGGWWFDKSGMTQQELKEMKARELRNGRLAMVSFLGAYVAASVTGKGPLTLLYDHVSDPLNNTIFNTLMSK